MRAARVSSVDVLRGVIIVVMALDHVRDWTHYLINPTDLAKTTIPLFATRWFTHFCAPVFMVLAGVGAYLQLSRGKSTILISHRFSTVRMADRILVLHDGHVEELGSHAELMRAGRRYAELFKLQAAGYQ